MKPDALEEPGTLETDAIPVRTLRESDLDAIVAIDAAVSGRRRPRYFELMLERAVKHSALQVSLVAEMDARVVGFLLATLYYGEFGVVEPTCSLEAIGVDPRYRRRRVGHALMRQLRLNLGALRISTLRTEVDWDDFELLAFLKRQGFVPAPRLCLETQVNPEAPLE
jgi:ribosomal protein S18 acetylase RimI-like enzyme